MPSTPDPSREQAPRPGKARKLTPGSGPRVLIGSQSKVARDRLRAQLAAAGFDPFVTSRPTEAVSSCRTHDFDCALIPLNWTVQGESTIEQIVAADQSVSVVAMADEPSVDDAVQTLRLGACDLLGKRTPGDELIERIRAACERTARGRGRDERIEQLRKLCRELNNARRTVTNQVTSMCDDLVSAYDELNSQVGKAGITGEFNGLIRQELDIEDLLRAVLEFTLAKVGPMNAGIFLPSTSGDFTLGAYVNYDCPTDTAEVLLDHLANTLAPRYEDLDGILLLENDQELDQHLGDDAHWLTGRCATIFSCKQRGECLAVVCLFRDAQAPLSDEQLDTIETIAELFSEQLERVVNIHHRHLPASHDDRYGDPLDAPPVTGRDQERDDDAFDDLFGPIPHPFEDFLDDGYTPPEGRDLDDQDDDIDLAA